MKTSETFATDLEVFGAQLYFQELMERVRGKKQEFAKLGEIKIGVYTPPRNDPPFLQGNEDVRKDNDAVIRIINESGYTVNGWHFDALPSTDFNGYNLKDDENQQIDDPNKFHFEILKKEMEKIEREITDANKKNNALIDKLTKNKEILIDELINLRLGPLDDENLSNEMTTYLNTKLNNPERLKTRVDINFNDIKAGIGLELELNLPLFAKFCCQTGGGMKKKHKRKTTKRTKGKKEKKGRKWSIKYKDSINCKKPKGFSQRQYCLAKSKKRKTAKKN